MSKIVDYVVLYEQDQDLLKREIIDFSENGYELAGGICVSYEHDKDILGDWFYQAMVKYEQNS